MDADGVTEDGSCWLAVGDRVCCGDHLGTVRYTGPVVSHSGWWVGVEWDDATRGKHGGSVNGHRYFSTDHASSGSLVRVNKLTPPVSCSAAVLERYGRVDNADTLVDQPQLVSLQRNVHARFIRIVGLPKVSAQQGRLSCLSEVYLRRCCVLGDSPPRLHELCPNIRDLDVSENLFSSWSHVAEIVRQLPHLRQLNVSGNRLPDPQPELAAVFGHVNTLFLNRQRYTWPQVQSCVEMFPQLGALTLLSNRITKIVQPPPDQVFACLDFLDLEDNVLVEWRHVLCLSQLPLLRELSLINTGLRSIYFDHDYHAEVANIGSQRACQKPTTAFASLQSLLLCDNALAEWDSINALNRLSSLCRIKLTRNPLNTLAPSDAIRSQVLARVGRLSVLNKSEVSREERRWAELDYLRQFGGEWQQAGGADRVSSSGDHTDGSDCTAAKQQLQQVRQEDLWWDFTLRHPRYVELCGRWGAPEPTEMRPPPRTIGDSLITVVVQHDTGSGTPWRRERKLPTTMSVWRLKVVVNKMLRGEMSRLRLSCCSSDKPGWLVPMSEEKDLSFYGIENGYSVIAHYE